MDYRWLWCVSVNFKQCTTLVEDVDQSGGYKCMGAGGIWKISVLSQFCCEPETALEKLSLSKKILGNCLLWKSFLKTSYVKCIVLLYASIWTFLKISETETQR